MRYAIGIDPGVSTGFAVWDIKGKVFVEISTLKIHVALNKILSYGPSETIVIVEDARLRKWFGNDREKNEAKKQNVGSVKRDCKIWDEFLKDHNYNYKMVKPKNTKVATPMFNKITGYNKRTSNHARDAAMIVYKYR